MINKTINHRISNMHKTNYNKVALDLIMCLSIILR
jgi:hypothetical protein